MIQTPSSPPSMLEDVIQRGAREYGASAALPIWLALMQQALQGQPEVKPDQPDNIVSVKIDPKTGLPAYTNGIFEIFRAEKVPDDTTAGQAYPSSRKPTPRLQDIF